MAVVSNATTAWTGDLANGSGRTTFETSGLGTFDVSWKARTEPGAGTTTPEELIAAAHASCFSMAFSHELAGHGTPPESVSTAAEVTFEPGTGITGIALTVSAVVVGITEEDFQRIAAAAKEGCPVSQALKATPITLAATLAA
ncbi:OsmC family peroxiredoxin [Ruania suaedae]|uniref:OsmC family peroxiredoxin n=1 Tax=Ruania suaedae TaxID=2897774 RepID=UPI001E2D2DDD|nr:OsmC family peroxiredoxin [Ruania suaedae]UFU04419.1 OsmC family peroxiredoxin [Ruania suaedae]